MKIEHSVRWFWLVIFLSSLFISFFNKYVFVLTLLTMLITMFLYSKSIINFLQSDKQINTVVRVLKTNKNSIIVEDKKMNYLVYTKQTFNINDWINLKGEITPIDIVKNSDFIGYYRQYNIVGIVKNPYINIFRKGNNFNNFIHLFIEKHSNTYIDYAKMFLLGNIYYGSDVNEQLKNLNIIHLFVISGFHVNIIQKSIEKMLFNRYIKLKFYKEITLVLLFLYLGFLGFSIPVLRAVLFIFLIYLNKKFFNNKIDKFTLFCICLFFVLSTNQNLIYSLSFVLTFLISFFVQFINLLRIKRKWLKSIVFVLVLSLCSGFINLRINNELSIFWIIVNIFFTPIISFYYIFSIIFWWFSPVMERMYWLLDILIKTFYQLNVYIKISHINLWLIYIMFTLLCIFLFTFFYKNNKPRLYIDRYF